MMQKQKMMQKQIAVNVCRAYFLCSAMPVQEHERVVWIFDLGR